MKKKTKITISISVVALLLIVVGVSYAYFSAQITGGEDSTTLNVTGGSLGLTVSGGNSITVSNTYPQDGAVATKTITVTGNNTTELTMPYTLNLVIDANTFGSSSIKYTLTSTNTDNTGTIIPSISSQTGITTGTSTISLGSGSFEGDTTNKVHTYVLNIYYPDTGASQNAEQGKSLSAHVTVTSGEASKTLYADNSGANAPELYDNMIPVEYDEANSSWKYADIYNDSWYDYDAKEWANAVVLVDNPSTTYSVGDTISMSDISQMYVWIPRYKYTIFNGNNGSAAAQLINVTFESGTESTGTVSCTEAVSGSGTTSQTCTDATNGSVTNGTSTYTHPAFTFGSTSLKGFWVGKFENSNTTACTVATDAVGTGCDLTTLGVQIKPNVTLWSGARVSTFSTAISTISSEYSIDADTHMMKNMEWGAAAYLSASKYGLGTTEIGVNNNSNYTTGCGASAGSSSSSTCNAYDTTSGKLASTTGNIYGIYDMSSSSYEYVMGALVYSDGTTMMSGATTTRNSGFTGILGNTGATYTGISFPNSKYYDAYTYSSDSAVQSRGKLGDATKEILTTYGDTGSSWFGHGSAFIYSVTSNYGGETWFLRGMYGIFAFTNNSGYTTYMHGTGNSEYGVGSRTVITE